jgi:alpha-amylase
MSRIVRRPWMALLAAAAAAACSSSSSSPPAAGGWSPGQPLTVSVAADFPAGTVLLDAYSGTTVAVTSAGTVTVTPDASGVVLLEPEGAPTAPFRWKNALVYFVMTDRFANGDPSNDHAFGRASDQAHEVGTWHGGDLAGLLARLDHVEALGATAIWITSPVEQVHGWVSGGTGDFKHYGYHGYWATDFTQLDPNLGTTADLHALVDGAHQRGIRVLLDVVMNHPGYATGDDLVACLSTVFTDHTGAAFEASYGGTVPPAGKTWASWNELVSYGSTAWPSWWGVDWIRAGLGGGYQSGGNTDLTRSLNFLPDFKTEATAVVSPPPLFGLSCKAGSTGVVAQPGFTVRDYLVKWHGDWVREYGVDGFRCDTVLNVETGSWKALKDEGTAALAGWKAANPAKALDGAPFWMTGEVYGHTVFKDTYYTAGGFDSLINFGFRASVQSLLEARPSLAAGASDLEALYSGMAGLLAPDASFDVLSYLSSHDTDLMFATLGYDAARQRQAGTALLLAPGGVQVFYGDESGRRRGPSTSDALQGTRSDMNWGSLDAGLLAHWRKLGTFRKRHPAVGAGAHARLASPDGTYAFARRLADAQANDRVVVILTPPR